MTERFEDYFEKLEELSVEAETRRGGAAKDRGAKELVRVEKQNVAFVIAFTLHRCASSRFSPRRVSVAEIAEKNGHVLLAYPSLFDYCVRGLKLSEGSVYRRLQVAAKSREFPELLDGLFENRFTLTVASILAPHLNTENVDALLSQAEGMSRREAEEVAARLRPKKEFKSSRRKVRRAKSEAKTPLAEGSPGVSEQAQGAREEDEKEKAEFRTADPRPIFEPATEDRYNYRFSAGKDFTEKLERFAEAETRTGER